MRSFVLSIFFLALIVVARGVPVDSDEEELLQFCDTRLLLLFDQIMTSNVTEAVNLVDDVCLHALRTHFGRPINPFESPARLLEHLILLSEPTTEVQSMSDIVALLMCDYFDLLMDVNKQKWYIFDLMYHIQQHVEPPHSFTGDVVETLKDFSDRQWYNIWAQFIALHETSN